MMFVEPLHNLAMQNKSQQAASQVSSTTGVSGVQALETETQLELQEMEQRLMQQERQAVRDLQTHREMAQLQVMHPVL